MECRVRGANTWRYDSQRAVFGVMSQDLKNMKMARRWG
jgi:hypothetical protein